MRGLRSLDLGGRLVFALVVNGALFGCVTVLG
jgi:hypothetical protein